MRLLPHRAAGLWAATLLAGCFISRPTRTRNPADFAPLTAGEAERMSRLQASVGALATDIGARDSRKYPERLVAAQTWIEAQWTDQGYAVQREPVPDSPSPNLWVELAGRSPSLVVIGAHYDTVSTTPGADDNASGVAALLELSRNLKGKKLGKTVRFVAFANEEPPWFQTDAMGSRVHASGAADRREDIVAMVTIESIGAYSTSRGSHPLPGPLGLLWPETGNYIGIYSNVGNMGQVTRTARAFRESVEFPYLAAALPARVEGIDWSDHWSFWEEGYPGVMVTDAPPQRNPHYHEAGDTAATLDFARMTRVVVGLEGVIRALAE